MMLIPKPTTYRTTHCRSRLEARWAVFFDYCQSVDSWSYEPTKVPTGPYGSYWYTPDFLVKTGRLYTYWEIKPKFPDESYFRELHQAVTRLKHPLYLAWGSFYRDEIPRIINLTTAEVLHTDKLQQEAVLLWESPLFPACQPAVREAQHFRFDLPRHPVPPHRQGSREQLEGYVRRSHRRSRKK